MDRTAKIGVAGVILVALGGATYWQYKRDAALGTPAAKGDLPEIHVGDDIDKIDIVNAGKGEVVLEKKGDKWEVTKPVSAPANQQNVKSLVDNLKELKITDRAVTKPDDDAKKTYELTADKGIHVTVFKGPDKKLDATFGKSGGLGDAMMVEASPDILLVKGYSSWMYGREVKDWRDRELFKLDDANVTSFDFENKSGKFAFVKNDKDFTGTFNGKPIDRLDTEKPKQALNSLKNLTAEDFADGKTAADTGLDQPEVVVSIKLKDGSEHKLKIGKALDKAHYAQRDSDPIVYTVGSFPYEWVTGDLAKFQQPSDAGAGDAGGKPAGPAGKGDGGKK